jgi:hypothetical protein
MPCNAIVILSNAADAPRSVGHAEHSDDGPLVAGRSDLGAGRRELDGRQLTRVRRDHRRGRLEMEGGRKFHLFFSNWFNEKRAFIFSKRYEGK